MTRRTRRTVLGLIGSAALAGCNALSGEPVADPVELDAAALRDAVAGDPTIPEMLPVDIGADYLDTVRGRVEDDLASVPDPVTAEDIPNAAVRAEFRRFREQSRSELDAAATAETPNESLERLRNARDDAAALAAGWAYTRGEFGEGDLAERRATLGDDAAAFAEGWTYAGEDPVRTTAVHAAIESRYERAVHEAEAAFDRDVRAIPLAEAAGKTVAGRVALSGARHLRERHRASLADPTDYRGRIAGAADTLAERARERAAAVPTTDDPTELVNADLERSGPAARALDMAWEGATEVYLRDSGLPASRVVRAVREFADISAFESVRSTLESDPAAFDVTTAADVRALRTAAVDAVAAALETEHASLARPSLESTSGMIAYADHDVRRAADNEPVPADSIASELAYYAHAAALARSIPDAAQRVAGVLTDG